MLLTKERLNELVPTHTEERKANLAKRSKKSWKDPEYKKRAGTKLSKAQKKRWTDPEYRKQMSVRIPPVERFHKLYTIDEETGCWNWDTSTGGYGVFSTDKGSEIAHRWYWQYVNKRTLPKHLYVCHHCDNPSCVNPDHMFIGTAEDNMKDAKRKGRKYVRNNVLLRKGIGFNSSPV